MQPVPPVRRPGPGPHCRLATPTGLSACLVHPPHTRDPWVALCPNHGSVGDQSDDDATTWPAPIRPVVRNLSVCNVLRRVACCMCLAALSKKSPFALIHRVPLPPRLAAIMVVMVAPDCGLAHRPYSCIVSFHHLLVLGLPLFGPHYLAMSLLHLAVPSW